MLAVLLAILGCPHPGSAPAAPPAPPSESPLLPEPSHVGGWHLFQAHPQEDGLLVHVDLLGEDIEDLVELGLSVGLEPRGAPEPDELVPADHELTRRLIHGYLGGTDLVDLWGWSGPWEVGVPATVQRVELAESPTGRVGLRLWLRPVDARDPALLGPAWGITRLSRGGYSPRGAPGTLDEACEDSAVLEVGGVDGQPACWHAPLEPGVRLAATLWSAPERVCTVLAYAHDGAAPELLVPLCRPRALVPIAWTADADLWLVVLQGRSWRALATLPAPGEAVEPSAWSRRPSR